MEKVVVIFSYFDYSLRKNHIKPKMSTKNERNETKGVPHPDQELSAFYPSKKYLMPCNLCFNLL